MTCAAERHGTRAAYVRGCRCTSARKANRDYAKYRDRRRAQAVFGAADPFTVPVEQARSVLTQLRGIGWSRRQIQAAAAVTRTQQARIEGTTNRPVQWVRHSTYHRLVLLLEQADVEVADHALIDAAETWQQIHGLVALGYPKTWIAQQAGLGRAIQIGPYLVTAGNARKIRTIAERYAAIPGPSDRARSYAAARGWTPELLWDEQISLPVDDEIPGLSNEPDVDEVAVERYVTGDNGIRLNRDEKWVAYILLRRRGETHNAAVVRVGISGQYATAYRERYEEAAAC